MSADAAEVLARFERLSEGERLVIERTRSVVEGNPKAVDASCTVVDGCRAQIVRVQRLDDGVLRATVFDGYLPPDCDEETQWAIFWGTSRRRDVPEKEKGDGAQ